MAARNSIEMAEANVVSAGLRPNPDFTFEAENYLYFGPAPGPFFSDQEITARYVYEIRTKRWHQLGTDADRIPIRAESAVLDDAARRLV